MRLIDTGVENCDLDSESRVGDAAEGVPRSTGIDEGHRAIQIELVVTQRQNIGDARQAGKFGSALLRGGDEDRVEKRIHLAGDDEASRGDLSAQGGMAGANLLSIRRSGGGKHRFARAVESRNGRVFEHQRVAV